jgi:hypothetical protein
VRPIALQDRRLDDEACATFGVGFLEPGPSVLLLIVIQMVKIVPTGICEAPVAKNRMTA